MMMKLLFDACSWLQRNWTPFKPFIIYTNIRRQVGTGSIKEMYSTTRQWRRKKRTLLRLSSWWENGITHESLHRNTMKTHNKQPGWVNRVRVSQCRQQHQVLQHLCAGPVTPPKKRKSLVDRFLYLKINTFSENIILTKHFIICKNLV